MQTTYGLVVVSAVMHAYWNYLIKRSGGTTRFVGLSKIAEAVVFAPVFLVVFVRSGGIAIGAASAALLIVVGAALTLANYVALSQAYARADLSVVYPLSRGAGLLFLPGLGFLAFDERLSAVGWLAIATILVGLIVTSRPVDSARAINLPGPAVMFALLAGLAAAGYTIWDKRAIQRLPTFIYFYAYSVLVAVAYGFFLRARFSRTELAAEWRVNRRPIVVVGIFNTLAYLLVLLALRHGTSTYVIALRQLSIAFGVGLGVWRLRERVSPRKMVGVAVLVTGCALVAFA